MRNKETLVKAARNYVINNLVVGYESIIFSSFIEGAKFQKQNSCEHNYILTSEQGHRVIKCLKCNNTQSI
jgi:hypothetical protein